MYPMLPGPAPEKKIDQQKIIIDIVVIVFLFLALLVALQYFHFIFLRDVPVIGNWLMDVYEQVFGVPKILIVHGDDSVGDWQKLDNRLREEVIFASQDIDVNDISPQLLARFSLVIVEDAKTIKRDYLQHFNDYYEKGGNIIWVGDAGTRGEVTHNDGTLVKVESGWDRKAVCINPEKNAAGNYTLCSCQNDTKIMVNNKETPNPKCKFLFYNSDLHFQYMLGLDSYLRYKTVDKPEMSIKDRYNWMVRGILPSFQLNETKEVALVSMAGSSANKVATVTVDKEEFPAIVAMDSPGAFGMMIYFAYPPEHTMEILKPVVERLRY